MFKVRTSSYLILLSSLLMLSVLSLAILINYVYKSLHNDAYIINHSGVVRGSIQRYSKLKLHNCNWQCQYMEKMIDEKIILLKEYALTNTSPINDKYVENLNKLTNEWNKLKSLVPETTDYMATDHFISQSETCWNIADSAVLLAEISSSSKLEKIRLYYVILGLTGFGFLIIIALLYFSVRNNLEKEIQTDHLTGLYNLKTFNKNLDREIARVNRYHNRFSLAMFDIDGFKQINDKAGHKAGDNALIEISDLVKTSLRSSDSIYRIGGDEFAIIFTETSGKRALEICEKLRIKICKARLFSAASISISLGVSEYAAGMGKESFLKLVDEALYEAKGAGKNITVFKQADINLTA